MRLLRSILLTAEGILSIIFSIRFFNMEDGSYEPNATYGGDAYTGMQNASAQAANNIQDLTKNVNKGMGYMLMIAGLTLISIGVSPVSCEKKKEDTNDQESKTNTAVSAQPSNESQDIQDADISKNETEA